MNELHDFLTVSCGYSPDGPTIGIDARRLPVAVEPEDLRLLENLQPRINGMSNSSRVRTIVVPWRKVRAGNTSLGGARRVSTGIRLDGTNGTADVGCCQGCTRPC